MSPPPPRAAYINFAVKADVATLRATSHIYTVVLPPLYDVSGATLLLTLQIFPISLLARSDALGGNVLGLHTADGPIVSVLVLSYWEKRSDDAVVIAFIESTLAHMPAHATAKGTIIPYIYVNYAFTGQ